MTTQTRDVPTRDVPSRDVPTRGYGQPASRQPQPTNLADLLERVLDKGVIIAGDIQVNLLDIELLTIRIRLLVASVDKAEEMGIDWWRNDPMLSSSARERADNAGRLEQENRELRERLEALEAGGRGDEQSSARSVEAAQSAPDVESEQVETARPGDR